MGEMALVSVNDEQKWDCNICLLFQVVLELDVIGFGFTIPFRNIHLALALLCALWLTYTENNSCRRPWRLHCEWNCHLHPGERKLSYKYYL